METTFYPAAGANSPVDGTMRSDSTSWDTAHDATSALTTFSDTNVNMDVGAALEGSIKRIFRSIFLFDASTISGDVVSDVIVSLFVKLNNRPDNDQYAYVNVMDSNPASNAAIVAEDYDQIGDAINNPTKFSSDLRIEDTTTSTYEDWILNATGKTFVQDAVDGDGIVKLGARVGFDIEDVPPSVSDGDFNGLRFSTADVGGTSQDPKLVVTHEEAVSTFVPKVMIY